jgi:hypothetical protein
MDWLAATGLGACGGGIVQAVAFSASVQAWQAARRKARSETLELPKIAVFMDPLADFLVLLTRLALGALAGGLFHAEIAGATVAVAVGCLGPCIAGFARSGSQRSRLPCL